MSNEMPTMPEIKENSLPGEVVNSGLPGEDEVKQDYITPETKLDSIVEIPSIPKKGIDVVATRAGFFGNRRIAIGQKFVVKTLEGLGLWMKCEDPELEKKRVKILEDKKIKAKR